MDKNQFSQKAISHKELSDFFIKAKKDVTSIDTSEKNNFKRNQEFDDLLKTWTETSQKILLMMNKEEKVLTENKSPKHNAIA